MILAATDGVAGTPRRATKCIYHGLLILTFTTSYYFCAASAFLTSFGFVAFYRPLPTPKEGNRSAWDRLLHEVDWVGTFLLLAFIVPFITGLTFGGTTCEYMASWQTFVC